MNSTRAQALAALAAALQFAAMTAVTEPVAEADRGPVDLRRTTLPVRDMERSLALYRDALGLRVVRDSQSVRPPEPGDPPDLKRTTRLVILCANDSFIGCLGLLERKPLLSEAPVEHVKPGYGNVYLVFNVKDLATRFARAAAVPGVVVESPPDFAAPSRAGDVTVIGSNVWDPDGYFVELNLLQGGPTR